MARVYKESQLEKLIADLVFRSTAEKVELVLNERITIRPVNRKGSILLAVFWANVLQCEANLPPSNFRYGRKPIHTPYDNEALTVKAGDDVIIQVHMKSGTLVVSATYVYEWFKNHFEKFLHNFDPEFCQAWSFTPSPVETFTAVEQPPEEPLELTKTERYMLMREACHPEIPYIDRKLQEGDEDWVEQVGNLNMDMTLWEDGALQYLLEDASRGALFDGLTVVYKLCLSLLNKWFKTPGTKVYIATPRLDSALLTDIVTLYLKHQQDANITALYTPVLCDPSANKTISSVKKVCMDGFNKSLRNAILYKIFRYFFHPCVSVDAVFVCGVKEGETEAELLLTSACFHSDQMKSRSAHTVQYIKLPSEQFFSKFIDPLLKTDIVATEY